MALVHLKMKIIYSLHVIPNYFISSVEHTRMYFVNAKKPTIPTLKYLLLCHAEKHYHMVLELYE